MRGFSVVVFCAACSFTPPLEAQLADDAPVDAEVSAGCVGSYREICFETLPDGTRDFEGAITLDTSADTTCDQVIASGCVIAAGEIRIRAGATVRAIGGRPLILVAARGDLEVEGRLDVSSTRAPLSSGAGALGGACGTATAATTNGGGAGGSFGARGGDGGEAGNGNLGHSEPAAPVEVLAGELRGGCPGLPGDGTGAGAGGSAGGALLLVAAGEIAIDSGELDASGAGGAGGGGLGSSGGGGGGGSGGMIVFDAPRVVIEAGAVLADGGGGGSGGTGVDGGERTLLAPGPGGTANPAGGAGGTGSVGGAGDDAARGGALGAGGGGGGAGIVRSTAIVTIQQNALLSPVP